MEARSCDRRAGRKVFFPVRYADDFIILVTGSREDAESEKAALETALKEHMRLTLSSEKTKITALTNGFQFLGHRIRIFWDARYGWTPRIEIPKEKVSDFKYSVKSLTGRTTTQWSLTKLLQKLNPILRGWANFYRYCTGAKEILSGLDWYVGDRIWRWLRKKFPKANAHEILRYRRFSHIRPYQKIWRADRMDLLSNELV